MEISRIILTISLVILCAIAYVEIGVVVCKICKTISDRLSGFGEDMCWYEPLIWPLVFPIFICAGIYGFYLKQIDWINKN